MTSGISLTDYTDYQKTVGNLALAGLGALRDLIGNRKRKVQILNGIDGVIEAGEMLVVLGPPGRCCYIQSQLGYNLIIFAAVVQLCSRRLREK